MKIRTQTIVRTLAAITLASMLSACEGFEPPPLPASPSNPDASTLPARLVLMVGSRPDHRLAVSASVVSADGHNVPNVVVTFSIGTGSVTPPTAATDMFGFAHAVAVSTAMTTISATTGDGLTESVFVLASQ